MTTRTTKYIVRRYIDNEAIGVANLTVEQFRHYEAMAQQPQGLIRLGAMPHDYYDLDAEFQGESEESTIWLD